MDHDPWIENFNFIKMSVLPKLLYKLKHNLNKNTTKCFIWKLDKLIMKLIWQNNKQNSQENSKKEKLIPPDIKTNFKPLKLR